MAAKLPLFQLARHAAGEVFSQSASDALRYRVTVTIILILRASAVEGFGDETACAVIVIRDRRRVIFCLYQTALSVIAKSGGAESVVAIVPRHLLICDLVGDIVAAVQAGAVREAGADTAACIIVFVRQRAPSEVGFSYQLSGFVIGESVTFAFGVNDFSQASEFIVPACQAFIGVALSV